MTRRPTRDRGRRPAHRARAGSSTTSTRCPARSSPPSCAARTRTPGSAAVDLDAARAHPGVAAVIGPEEVRATFGRSRCPRGADALLPDGDRQGALRRGARRRRRRRRPVRRRGRGRAGRGRLRAARRRGRTRAALEPDAPLLHDQAGSNVATDRTFSFGEVEGAFAAAAHVVEGEYTSRATPRCRWSATPSSPHWRDGADGPAVEAWANFHGPFTMVPVVAGALGIPTSSVRLHVPGRHRRQLRDQVRHLPVRRADGAGQQARRHGRCAGPRTASST